MHKNEALVLAKITTKQRSGEKFGFFVKKVLTKGEESDIISRLRKIGTKKPIGATDDH